MKKSLTLPVIALTMLLGVVACSNRGSSPIASVETDAPGPTTVLTPTTVPVSSSVSTPATTSSTNPTVTTIAPVTKPKPAPTTTQKPSSIPQTAITNTWATLSVGVSKFFQTGDLAALDSAFGAVETKYKTYGLTAVLGGSGDRMTIHVTASGYTECRHVDLTIGVSLVPGC